MKKVLKLPVQVLIIISVSVLLLYYFNLDFTQIQGTSMSPTIENGDRIVVEQIRNEPDYNDVIVFSKDNRNYIKRVIGKGGDTIRIKDNTVYRNDEALQEEFASNGDYPDFNEVVVPRNKYFVLGDNRDNSLDSRSAELGFVCQLQIKGKAVLRY